MPCFRSPGGLNFGRRRRIVIGTHHGTCFMSPFCCPEFWHVQRPGSGATGYYVSSCYGSDTSCNGFGYTTMTLAAKMCRLKPEYTTARFVCRYVTKGFKL